MFKKRKQVYDKEIAENLPIEIAILLWNLIDDLTTEKIIYNYLK